MKDPAWFTVGPTVSLTKFGLLLSLAVHSLFAAAVEPAPNKARVFAAGENGYHTFRIPSLTVTARGILVAFSEGRRQGAGDSGDVDLVCRRSTDLGKTWSDLQVVWNDSTNTCGNPCAVSDSKTGALWLAMTWNRGDDNEAGIIAQRSKDTRRVYVSRSVDDGVTWSMPREITARVKPTNWTWYATGPGAGIQIQHGPHSGRLIIPCDHIEAGTRRYGAHVIYSDDHGESWRLGGSAPHDQVNECEVVELEHGRLMLNMRNYDRSSATRQTALSVDGGESWSDQKHAPELIDPICQGSIRRYAWPGRDQFGVILFSNPGSGKREQLTVRASFDDGQTWPVHRLVEPGPSAYSCLATLPDGTVGLMYEAGKSTPYEGITFARFSMHWLTNRTEKLVE
jgi:sialidase-1